MDSEKSFEFPVVLKHNRLRFLFIPSLLLILSLYTLTIESFSVWMPVMSISIIFILYSFYIIRKCIILTENSVEFNSGKKTRQSLKYCDITKLELMVGYSGPQYRYIQIYTQDTVKPIAYIRCSEYKNEDLVKVIKVISDRNPNTKIDLYLLRTLGIIDINF